MKIYNNEGLIIIKFKSTKENYENEKNNKKSNTIRTLNQSEYNKFIDEKPTHIRIVKVDQYGMGDGFTKEITHILHLSTDHINNTVTFLFSWG